MTAPPALATPQTTRSVMGRLDPARLLPVAWPVYIELMSGVIAGIITVVWIARLGAPSLAAVTMAGSLENVLLSIALAVSGGATVVVSRALGASEFARVRPLLRSAFRVTAVITVVTVAVLFAVREPLAKLVLGTGDASGVQLAVDYLTVSVPGIALFYGQYLVDSTFKADGDTRTPMRMALLSNAILIVADPTLIYGWMGAPRLGVRGSAIALVSARLVTLLVTYWLYRRSRLLRKVDEAPAATQEPAADPKVGLAREILQAGIPIGVDFLVRMTAGMLIVGVVARFGTNEVAAYGTVTRMLLVLTMMAYAVRQAGTIIAAKAKGATDDTLLTASRRSSVRLGISWSVLGGLVLLLLGGLVVDALTNDAAVRSAAHGQIPWLAAYVALLLCNVTLSGIFMGGGQGKIAATSTTVGAVLQLCLAPLLAITPLGLDGAWIAMIVNAGTQTTVLLVLSARQIVKAKEVTA